MRTSHFCSRAVKPCSTRLSTSRLSVASCSSSKICGGAPRQSAPARKCGASPTALTSPMVARPSVNGARSCRTSSRMEAKSPTALLVVTPPGRTLFGSCAPTPSARAPGAWEPGDGGGGPNFVLDQQLRVRDTRVEAEVGDVVPVHARRRWRRAQVRNPGPRAQPERTFPRKRFSRRRSGARGPVAAQSAA